jgi:hypothetical protein
VLACGLRSAGTRETHKDAEHELGRNGEQVSLESREAHLTENEREVVLWRLRWDVRGQANQVEWPQIIVLQTLPESVERDGLAIVHVTLRGIITKDSVY